MGFGSEKELGFYIVIRVDRLFVRINCLCHRGPSFNLSAFHDDISMLAKVLELVTIAPVL